MIQLRSLLAALALLLLLPAGLAVAQQQVTCTKSVVYDASTSGSTELVAAVTSARVYICGYTILAAGTVNVKLIGGTGTACATGSVDLTPAYQLTTQTGAVDGSQIFRGLGPGPSQALCINTSAGVAVQALIYYNQIR